jgi:hypothetical protein
VVKLVGGVDYTLTFAAKASARREIVVAVGSKAQRFPISTNWRRLVMTFRAPRTGQYRVAFGVGKENTEVSIDSVRLFVGNPNVFAREFDRALVVVNATPRAHTVYLGHTYRRIKGTQDPINNGASVTQVTINPYDAALLVKP